MQKVILLTIFLASAGWIRAQRVRLTWTPLDSLTVRYEREPRPLLILVEASWCGWCKALKKRTLSDAATAQYLNKHYYLAAMDGESAGPITWLGKTFVPRFLDKQHELANYWQRGNPGYPTLVWLTSPNAEPAPLPGYLKPAELEPFLAYFVESGPTQESFEQFLKRRFPNQPH